MKKLFALSLTTSVFAYSSIVFAADEVLHDGLQHSEIGDEIAQGIHDAEHASKGGLPQFDPEWFASQTFWLAISFAVMYFFFAKKTLPDISGVIENRKNHIQSDLETAEKLTKQADDVHDAYQEGLTLAQSKASEAVQKVESDMKEKSAKAFEDFRKTSEDEVQAAEARITASKNAMMDDMNNIAAEAAASAVEKIIGRNTKADEVKSIVESLNGGKKAKAA